MVVNISQQQENWGQKTLDKASISKINSVLSTESACKTLSKLFDMSISQPLILVYTANSSTNTIKVIKPNKTSIQWTPGSQIYRSNKKIFFWSKMIFEQKRPKYTINPRIYNLNVN